jgi:hypothetical protein
MNPNYFYLIKALRLHLQIKPALAESWRRKSFAPCRDLCQQLHSKGSIPEGALLRSAGCGLPFDRRLWQALVGECLVHGADAMPRVPVALEFLRALLAPARGGTDPAERSALDPIEQVFLGTRDLAFGGGCYRPEHAGWNDCDDVARLHAYLRSVRTEAWSASDLVRLTGLADETEREEELAHLRDWWPALVEIYDQASRDQQVIVCERP